MAISNAALPGTIMVRSPIRVLCVACPRAWSRGLPVHVGGRVAGFDGAPKQFGSDDAPHPGRLLLLLP